MKKIIIATLTAGLLVGCGINLNKEDQGTVIGSLFGVAIGSMIGDGNGRVAAMVLGGIFGAAVGNRIGAQLDERDRLLLANNTQSALEYGKSGVRKDWVNPDTNHSGTTTPGPAYTNQNNRQCRDFTQTIYIDGKREIGKGTACRNSAGEWLLQ